MIKKGKITLEIKKISMSEETTNETKREVAVSKMIYIPDDHKPSDIEKIIKSRRYIDVNILCFKYRLE
jgi:thiamine biosynthesis protein ThiC